jgi:hypothetical protein
MAVLSAQIVPPTVFYDMSVRFQDKVYKSKPYEAFSMLAPLKMIPSEPSKAAPTRNREYGLYEYSFARSECHINGGSAKPHGVD